MSILLTLLSLTVLLLPAVLFLLPAVRLWVLNRRWVPAGSARSASVRRTEAALLLLIAIPVLVLWLYRQPDADFVPQAFSQSFAEETRRVLQWGLLTAAVGCLVAAILAWRVSTSWAAGILVCVLTGGQIYVQQVLSAQFREATDAGFGSTEPRELADLPPIHIRFELPDNLSGGDLWVNGVHLGQTPYETTVQELLNEVPTWSHEERRTANEEDRHESWTYDARGYHGTWTDRWGWCPLHIPGSVSHPDESVYYKVDLGPLRGYSRVAQQRMLGRHDSPDRITVIELDTKFPEWEGQIEELLDRARLADYSVGADWFAALGSYGSYGRERLNASVREEPGFNRVLDDWARHEYGLAQVGDSDDAWQALMRIQDETRASREYASDSLAGRAVDLLVPQLDPRQLTDYAIYLLETTPRPDPGSSSHGGDPPAFRTYRDGEPPTPDAVALWPIAQAVWRMDRQLDEGQVHDETESVPVATVSTDAEHATHAGGHVNSNRRVRLAELIDAGRDNIIEREITPELLRMSYRNIGRLRYASVLGGSSFERFLVRQDWRAEPDAFTPGVQHVGHFENRVNPWFFELLWLRGPVGREFRRQNASRLLELARDSIEDFDLMTGQLPDDLGFLFLDREWSGGEPSLAMRFRDEVDRMAKLVPEHNREQALSMRWDYLGRLWPESTVEMFVDAYAEQPLTGRLFATLPDSVEPSDQVEIYSALLDFEVERHERLPDDGSQSMQNPAYVSNLNRDDLQRQLLDLPCEAAALLALDQLRIEPGGPLRRDLPERMRVDTVHDDLVRLLAGSGEPGLQRMALTAIEHHPTPVRRTVLAGLLEAPDAEVREAAKNVRRELDRLSSGPLSGRVIPTGNQQPAR